MERELWPLFKISAVVVKNDNIKAENCKESAGKPRPMNDCVCGLLRPELSFHNLRVN